ncbi:kinase-like domain-containing protein [Suillus ampliporus]|nr:kinase-like domain-containing protein [Suillus ampliporus]
MKNDLGVGDLPDDLTPFITRTTPDPVNGGSYGDVWKCNYNADGISAHVAVKAFRFPEGYDLERINRKINREIGILKILRHDNIVPLWGTVTGFGRKPEFRCLVSPWMPNGTLSAYLASNHNDLTVLDRSRMLEDVSAGLRYLHSVPAMHGDITGANILIDERGHARLIDFGLSTIVRPLLGLSHLAVTSIRPGALLYAAPELVLPDDSRDLGPLEKADIYSFGCVMLQILSGRLPWSEIKSERPDLRIVVMISEGRRPQRPDGHPAIIDLDWDFIQKCLQFGPKLRPSADEVLDFVMHRFFSSDSSRPPDDPPDHAQDGFPEPSPHDRSEGEDTTEQPPNSPPPSPDHKLKTLTIATHTLFSSDSSRPPDDPPGQAEDAIWRAIHNCLDNTPLRLLDVFTGRLCNRAAQINAFQTSSEYKELLSSTKHLDMWILRIQEVVETYFCYAMLSHRWEGREPLLHDILDKVVYELHPIGGIMKLQSFCKVALDAGYRWAWSDTCCIDQTNNVELQRSVNSMFAWYRNSALTIVYLSDVPPSSKSGGLANSAWNTRGWTLPELLAPRVMLFYQNDWTYILTSTLPTTRTFRPGVTGGRQKLQWASTRITMVQEDTAYSLFGIFGVYLPVIYGETKQNALGRLSQEIVAQSGDITALDWVGKSSRFNSCLPADITSYKAPPCTLSSLSEDQLQTSVSSLRNADVVKLALTLYTRLASLGSPRFANRTLRLPCIVFPITTLRRRGQDRDTCFSYDVEADGLQDLLITTEDRLIQFSRARPIQQPFLLIRPWNRHDLGLPDLDDVQSMEDWSEPESPSEESLGGDPGKDSESQSQALRLIVRLGQPFGAILLAQQRGGEYKRVAPDSNIIAQVKDAASVHGMMDIRALEIL